MDRQGSQAQHFVESTTTAEGGGGRRGGEEDVCGHCVWGVLVPLLLLYVTTGPQEGTSPAVLCPSHGMDPRDGSCPPWAPFSASLQFLCSSPASALYFGCPSAM